MKLKQYLNEQNKNFNGIVRVLERDCKEYLDLIRDDKNTMLFRGTEKSIKDMKKIKPRKNRKPKDTPNKIQEKLDEFYYKKFGWKPRSEGIFVTSRRLSAMSYGTAYMFFPIGGYKFLWSKDIRDLFGYIDAKIYSRYKFELGDDYLDYSAKDFEKEYDKEINLYNSFTEEDPEYKLNFPEIFNNSKKEYTKMMVDKYDDIRQKIYGFLESNISSYTDKNLLKAIELGNEIMFKCREYYLVSNLYTDEIYKYLNING